MGRARNPGRVHPAIPGTHTSSFPRSPVFTPRHSRESGNPAVQHTGLLAALVPAARGVRGAQAGASKVVCLHNSRLRPAGRPAGVQRCALLSGLRRNDGTLGVSGYPAGFIPRSPEFIPRHSRESGNPAFQHTGLRGALCAGMTKALGAPLPKHSAPPCRGRGNPHPSFPRKRESRRGPPTPNPGRAGMTSRQPFPVAKGLTRRRKSTPPRVVQSSGGQTGAHCTRDLPAAQLRSGVFTNRARDRNSRGSGRRTRLG
jgi:hypothetical protein